MKIQIYGSGCDKCQKLAANAAAAIQSTGSQAEIEKVTDINAITEAGVMMTPALGIDGKVVSSGKVLSPAEIAGLLKGEPPADADAPCSCGDGTASTACCAGAAPGSGNAGKKFLTILLLALIVFSVVAMVVRELNRPKADPVTGSDASVTAVASETPVAKGTVVVYYFHGNQRCMTCNKIEELTRQAVNGRFAAEIAAGKVVVRSVNVEQPENEHFIRDFELSTRSVVMQKDGKYEKFDAVWTLVREPAKFTAYIQDGVNRMLAE